MATALDNLLGSIAVDPTDIGPPPLPDNSLIGPVAAPTDLTGGIPYDPSTAFSLAIPGNTFTIGAAPNSLTGVLQSAGAALSNLFHGGSSSAPATVPRTASAVPTTSNLSTYLEWGAIGIGAILLIKLLAGNKRRR